MRKDWIVLPFSKAVMINPKVSIAPGSRCPFVDMKSVEPGKKEVDISQVKEFKGSGSKFELNDTLFARITPCLENGKIALYKPQQETASPDSPAFGSTEFIVFRGREGVTDNDFVYYLANNETFKNFAIGQMIGTSGRQRVPTSCFNHYAVLLPPLKEQRAIAKILKALDDKIEINRRMNETLEEMAEAIFKNWFVDFDPVHRKAQGCKPQGIDDETATLFPDSFQDSEIGMIPRGWHVRRLGDFINFIKGKKPGILESASSTAPHILIAAFEEQPREIVSTKNMVIAETDDVLMVMDGASSGRTETGFYGVVGSTIAKIETVPEFKPFLYFFLKHHEKEITSQTTGTSIPHADKGLILSLAVGLPKNKILDSFNQQYKAIREKISLNRNESSSLRILRDTLLPKLLSGEIYVKTAERQILRTF